MDQTIQYILVSDGPLIGPFPSKEAAEQWAKDHGFMAKWVEEVTHPSFFEEGAKNVAH